MGRQCQGSAAVRSAWLVLRESLHSCGMTDCDRLSDLVETWGDMPRPQPRAYLRHAAQELLLECAAAVNGDA
eukprot:11313731-Karenia_brevis.AAC.1